MKIVLTCGHPHAGYELPHFALVANGLAEARPSHRNSIHPAALHEQILRAHGVDPDDGGAVVQLSPGKVWQELAVDLFMANLTSEHWGWADPRTTWLLDFWKTFDPQIHFLLVYCAPEYALGRALRSHPATPETVAKAIASWSASHSEMLRFYHRNAGRCLLVNVTVATYSPARFVEKAAERFGLTIDPTASGFEPHADRESALSATLARALVEDHAEVNALFHELESSADLDGAVPGVRDVERLGAWEEYAALLANLERTRGVAREQTLSIERLHEETAEAGRLLTGERERVMECEIRLADQDRRLQQLQLEGDDLRHSLEARDIEVYRLRQVEKTYKRQIEEQTAALEKIRSVGSETEQLQARNVELTQENELLLLQLHQVQEELERYFLQCRELSNQAQRKLNSATILPSEISVDLRRDIVGDNWYYPEQDGRWAGPERISTLSLPMLGKGHYAVQFDIVDAMAAEILSSMEVSLNGKLLETSIRSVTRKKFPVVVHAQFDAVAIDEREVWEFQFKFRKLISPAERGSEDQRILAIRLRSVRLMLVEP